jgi:RNA-binding protein
MAALVLKPAERARLRAEAHHLHPLVTVGGDGATPGVRHELEAALAAHGLVKVRVADADRVAREALLAELAKAAGAAPVQHIGRLLVLWRPLEAKDKAPREDRGKGVTTVKIVQFAKSGNHRPTVKRVRIEGNMRIAQGGTIKRAAKKKPASLKKRSQSA